MNGAEIMLSNGRLFDLHHPDPKLLDIDVIAKSLSRLCRYNGHTQKFYSVAEHCVLVSHAVPWRMRLAGLLHDAAEAFVGDMTSPLKRSQPGFVAVEEKILNEIERRYLGHVLSPRERAEVKRADMRALATEVDQLMPPGAYWSGLPEPLFTSWPLGMSMAAAETSFLEAYAKAHR